MNGKKLSYLLAALTVLLGASLIASGFLANQVLVKKSKELNSLKAQSQVASDLQQSLKQDKADIARYAELNHIAQAIVPQDKDQSQTIGEIVKIAADSGIPNLSSITFPASSLGGTGAAKSSTKLTQLTPVKGISSVYILPITITQDGAHTIPYSSFMTFLRKLENNRRTAQVSSVNIQPDLQNADYVSFTLIVNEYIKP